MKAGQQEGAAAGNSEGGEKILKESDGSLRKRRGCRGWIPLKNKRKHRDRNRSSNECEF